MTPQPDEALAYYSDALHAIARGDMTASQAAAFAATTLASPTPIPVHGMGAVADESPMVWNPDTETFTPGTVDRRGDS